MNLLQAQDALKNASDQQLMALMQSPDSTAPSYLVLSEIRRRKDMRAKQAPEGAPNRTVAEELTAPQAPVGIQALQGMAPQGSMDPDGVDAAEGGVQGMAAGGLASLRRYQEGGVVRMEGGGRAVGLSPIIGLGPSGTEADLVEYPFMAGEQDPVLFGRPLNSYGLEELQRLKADDESPRLPRTGGRGLLLLRPGSNLPALPMEAINRRIATLRGRDQPRFSESPSISENAPSLEALGGAPPATATHPAVTTTQPAGAQPPTSAGSPTPQTAPTSTAAPQAAPAGAAGSIPGMGAVTDLIATGSTLPPAAGQRPAPSTGSQRPTAGIGTLAPAAAHNESQVPGLADIMRRNAELFPDNMSGIRSQMREDRVDPAARRNEAVNMALIEAGLRIAGSRNPSLIGAIGEGALPAVQSYGQQLGQIRGEQRQSRQDELELAKQEVTRQYAIGQISASEYRGLITEAAQNARLRQQLVAQGIQSERAIAAQAATSQRQTDAQIAIAERQAAAQGATTNRMIQLEEMRDVRDRERVTRREEALAHAAIATEVSQALRTPGAMEMKRAEIIQERRRENPTVRNPIVTNIDVENYLVQQGIRSRQAALAYGRQQGQQGVGGGAPAVATDTNPANRPPMSSFQR